MSLTRKAAKLLDPEIRAKNLRHLHLQARKAWWHLRQPTMPDPVFVIGCSRAGTTVTFETLAASGDFVHFPFELPQFWNQLAGPHHNGWDSEAASAADARPGHREQALAHYFAHLGSGRVLDKTCINTLRVPYLSALFPQARFVFIQRDGRDNISSMMDGWRHGRTDGGFSLTPVLGPPPCEVAIEGGQFREWHFFLPPDWRRFNHASLEAVCAHQWQSANRLALDAASALPAERWITLRHEAVLDSPVSAFRAVFRQLGLPFHDHVRQRCDTLASRPTSIVLGAPRREKWRTQNPDAIRRILPDITPTMERLGYECTA